MGVDVLPDELDKTCDLVITVGAMGPGHCPPPVMEAVLTAMKKGGFYVFCIRDKYWQDNDLENPFKELMDKMIEEGKYVQIHRHRYKKGTEKMSGEAHAGWLKVQEGSIFCF